MRHVLPDDERFVPDNPPGRVAGLDRLALSWCALDRIADSGFVLWAAFAQTSDQQPHHLAGFVELAGLGGSAQQGHGPPQLAG